MSEDDSSPHNGIIKFENQVLSEMSLLNMIVSASLNIMVAAYLRQVPAEQSI